MADDDMKHMKRRTLVVEVEQKVQRKITTLIILMTLAFYVTWTPYAISSLLTMAGVSLSFISKAIAALCTKTSVVINPILYIFLNTDVSNSV